MISEQAKDSIERIFCQAARTRLTVGAGDSCDVAHGTPHGGAADGEVVVLTISSIAFRLLLILHFDHNDDAMRSYYLGARQATLTESLLEIGNLCCGAMNQQLVEYFPDLGMSTPYVLSGQCVPYLDQLKPDFLVSYHVTVNRAVHLGATLCVCADSPLDFVANVSEVAESVGELELF
ncbi:hypothetical protein FAZ69_13510 [Trinickia terrae]|uniref:Chemotaxis protein CheX n=1 Tax=Trinickia terrae TaxID=2571161 RepID=A0A4U1I5X7_9BURK|nr:hypothetical protein [Trinickia terrae]TKC88761.1 hypothetical protein FAZ69_13510 [Trinickia terrae]